MVDAGLRVGTWCSWLGTWLGAVGIACALQLAGCGDDEADKPADKPDPEDAAVDTGPTEMTRPTGGRSGGTENDDGLSNSAAYRCVQPVGDPGGSVGVGGVCCGTLGTCTAAGEGESVDGLPHDTCSARGNLRCVPSGDPQAADADAGGTTGLFEACRVQFPGAPADAASFEGRCVPACFAKASPVAARLQRASCGEAELCAPCYNPLDGAATGLCDVKGDQPLESAPPGFATCGGELGYCVPAYAAGMSAGQLQPLTCPAGELCAPRIKVANPGACFERCESVAGAGSCVPEFLTQNLGSFLTQASCGTGEICAPCNIAGVNTFVCD